MHLSVNASKDWVVVEEHVSNARTFQPSSKPSNTFNYFAHNLIGS
jgi:hypothetical protein